MVVETDQAKTKPKTDEANTNSYGVAVQTEILADCGLPNSGIIDGATTVVNADKQICFYFSSSEENASVTGRNTIERSNTSQICVPEDMESRAPYVTVIGPNGNVHIARENSEEYRKTLVI